MPLIGFACVVWVAVSLVEGVGALGVAGTLNVMEVVEGLGEILDGTFGWQSSQSRTIKEAMFICIQDPPSTGIWASTNWHIYGTSYYMHHQHSSANQHNSQQQQPTHNPPTGTPLLPLPLTSPAIHLGGVTYFFLLLFLLVSTCVYPKHPPLLIYI